MCCERTWHSASQQVQLATAVTNKTSKSPHAFSLFMTLKCALIQNTQQKYSFTYIVVYSFTIRTKFDKRTQYMINCIHLDTVY